MPGEKRETKRRVNAEEGNHLLSEERLSTLWL
jgi:hypothetical protein